MKRSPEQILAAYGIEGTVIRELHDVPPYRVYDVRSGDQRVVLKIDDHPRGHAVDEGRVHEYVAENTSAPVPAVIAVGGDHYITTWDEGIANSTEQVDRQWARAAGEWLGVLHADTGGEFDGFGRPVDGAGRLDVVAHENWVDAVTDRIAYHRPYLETKGYADVANAVETFFREHPTVFDGVGEPVLCHGDCHPEHHVRTDGNRVVAIDFEHALVAPAEYDYWRTAMPYFEARADVDERVKRAFQNGYESVRSLPEGFDERRPLYRLLNSVAFLESLHLQRTVEAEKRNEMGTWIRGRVFEILEDLYE